jgi:hypothetical protein
MVPSSDLSSLLNSVTRKTGAEPGEAGLGSVSGLRLHSLRQYNQNVLVLSSTWQACGDQKQGKEFFRKAGTASRAERVLTITASKISHPIAQNFCCVVVALLQICSTLI